jgi:Ca2+/Na+ antiporter
MQGAASQQVNTFSSLSILGVGFGASAPEMVVSALAASQGNSGIALGNDQPPSRLWPLEGPGR